MSARWYLDKNTKQYTKELNERVSQKGYVWYKGSDYGEECLMELFGFDYEEAKRVRKHGKPVFDDPDHQDMYDMSDPRIITREGLKVIIDIAVEKILEILKSNYNYYTPDRFIQNWESGEVLNLNLDEEKIVNWTCSPLYVVFELVRLYKTFDFENYDLVFSGGV